ncbi:major outer membrane protein [Helicobacter canadensis]|uniref:Outer membrane protein n=1 Tax=Helicobacter canadensis MIT 98-5491 TaxID=537970 RepID=C5ZXM2_9HELI|nr:major outer membrane protein [Helicobacter canadensis]EES89890.1 putative outer membrane protein [Helicobacter canadensis MIT 98-5491]STO99931.1 outer membrane protein [Helicobacter canadensis]
MKFIKLSLAASVALGALSTASFAQPLEEAIKGIDVSGYLRYRYNDDRYNDSTGNAAHQWRAVADFKTPVVNNVALNFGVWYQNENNVNHGKGTGNETPGTAQAFTGSGLGSGSDGQFGVREFYATITPDSTATTIKIGKQLLDTPVTNAYDGDRGTGILALNSDIPNLTLAAAAFDSWSINEVNAQNQINNAGGVVTNNGGGSLINNGLSNDYSIDKPLYALAGIYGIDTNYGRFGGQLWGFYIDDTVDALVFGELSWQGSLLRAKLQYSFAALNNDSDSIFAGLYGYGTANRNKANISEANDAFVVEVGADFRNDFQLPLNVALGYITNFADGTAVALEDEGSNVSRKGKIWWQNAGTGISTSVLRGYGVQGFGTEQDIDVFYAGVDYSFLDERLNVGLEFAWGENDISYNRVAAANNNIIKKVEFTEITPTITWKHSKQLTLSTYYAFLKNDYTYVTPVAGQDQDRDRFRVEAKYSF